MLPGPDQTAFRAPMERHEFKGILLDLDGTIVDSTAAIVKHWHKSVSLCPLSGLAAAVKLCHPSMSQGSDSDSCFSPRQVRLGDELGVDPNVILASSHGRRSIDTLQMYDPSKANWEYTCHIEGLIPQLYGSDATEIPGARTLLAALEEAKVKWAIVTSGTRPLATGWLDVMKLTYPPNLVTAEDVEAGKPNPECYLLGKTRLDLDGLARVLVIEDAPAGVLAGKSAGCNVVGVATTHDVAQLKAAGADWIVRDLRSVRVMGTESDHGAVTVEIWNSLEN